MQTPAHGYTHAKSPGKRKWEVQKKNEILLSEHADMQSLYSHHLVMKATSYSQSIPGLETGNI